MCTIEELTKRYFEVCKSVREAEVDASLDAKENAEFRNQINLAMNETFIGLQREFEHHDDSRARAHFGKACRHLDHADAMAHKFIAGMKMDELSIKVQMNTTLRKLFWIYGNAENELHDAQSAYDVGKRKFTEEEDIITSLPHFKKSLSFSLKGIKEIRRRPWHGTILIITGIICPLILALIALYNLFCT